MDEITNQTDGSGPEETSGPKFLSKMEDIAVGLSALAVLALCVLVTTSVMGRAFSLFIVPDHIIFSGELMVLLVALPWAAVARSHGHIAVEVFTNRLRASQRLWLAGLSALVGTAMILPLTFAAYQTFARSVERGSYFDGDLFWPEWPGRAMFALGFALLAIRLLYELTRVIRRIGQGSYNDIKPEDGYF